MTTRANEVALLADRFPDRGRQFGGVDDRIIGTFRDLCPLLSLDMQLTGAVAPLAANRKPVEYGLFKVIQTVFDRPETVTVAKQAIRRDGPTA